MEPNYQAVIGLLSERIRQLELDKAFLAAEILELKNKKESANRKECGKNGSRCECS